MAVLKLGRPTKGRRGLADRIASELARVAERRHAVLVVILTAVDQRVAVLPIKADRRVVVASHLEAKEFRAAPPCGRFGGGKKARAEAAPGQFGMHGNGIEPR